uniref:Reverse transcriptase domain-containing protein n=1 Tax=Cannabis sativa TaxID=3483 RepID=A0A803NK38_CANSA
MEGGVESNGDEEGLFDDVRQQFMDSMSLELEADVELSDEVTKKGVLATTFGRRSVARGRVKEILGKMWKLEGHWRMKTMKPGLWGIFFDSENDKKEVLKKRHWLVNGALLNIREWPEDGIWANLDMNKARYWVEAHGFYLNISRDRKEWVQFKYHKLPAICFNCGCLAHSFDKCNRPQEFAYPPVGKAVPLYGAWIKVGVLIRSCFDPVIPRMKLPEKSCEAHDVRPVAGKDKGKLVITEKDRDGTKKACLGQSWRVTELGNANQHRLRASLKTKKHPMNGIDNKRRDEGIIASLMADIGPTRDQMVERPHEEICSTFSGAKKRKASVSIVPVIDHGDNVNNMGEKTPATPITMLPTLEVNTFVPGSSSRGSTGSKKRAYSRSRGGGSSGRARRGSKVGSKRGEKYTSGSGGISARIKDSTDQWEWYLFAVYGRSYDSEKKEFWDWMKYRVSRCQRPWMMVGDLNLIAHLWEKCGGKRVSGYDTAILQRLLLRTRGIDLGYRGSKGYEAFRFFEAWARERSCGDIIKQAWGLRGSRKEAICGRLSDTRRALQKWKKGTFGDCDGLIKEAEERIGWIQKQPLSEDLMREESSLQARIAELWIRKESMWRQKSKELWLKVGDRNSKFFHASTIIRRRRNEISAIKNDVGGWETEARRIGYVFNGFFHDLYNSDGVDLDESFFELFSLSVTREENDRIKAIPEKEEIWNAVAAMHPLKAPGPDGMPGCFYRRYWDVVGSEVTTMVQLFFSTGSLERQLNYTYICLIPKEENASSVDRFRPISLCNFAYKIIFKIIATRLREAIDKLISPFQSAFVPGRWIAECSILTQELVHTIKRKKGKGGLMALKLDMLKAYDRIEWNFLHEVLKGNGFDSRVLSKLITKQQTRGHLNGIKISRSAPAISHLMFADDTILFVRANKRMASNLLECIHKYESWSGQKCSLMKSSVLFSGNVGGALKSNILKSLNVKECNGEEKHLGNPFVFKRRKREEYMFLKEKVMKRIEGWKAKLLSFAGRTTLVKSVALSIPLYVMSTNKIPVSTCRDIERAIRKYWWTGNKEKDRFMALVGWDGLCSPMAARGLGFRKLEDMNNALMAKLAWQCASQTDRPWVTCLTEKYCKKDSFWGTSVRATDSTFWKGILHTRDVIRKGCMTLVGRGDSVDIWKQPWIPWLEYMEFIELLNQVRPRFPNFKTVEDLTNENGSWNIELLKEMFGESLGQRIGEIKRLPPDQKDTLVWKDAADGTFTVKRGYFAMLQGNGDSPKGRLSWILSSMPPDLVTQIITFIGCLFEGIWNARNEFLIKGKSVDIEGVRCFILKRYTKSLLTANEDCDWVHISTPAELQRRGIGSNVEAFCVTDASWKDGVLGGGWCYGERTNRHGGFARNTTA